MHRLGAGLRIAASRCLAVCLNPVINFPFAIIGQIGSELDSMAAAGKPVFPMVKVGKTDLEFAAVEFNDCEFSALPLGPLDWQQLAAPFFPVSSR